ncbi:hypothetical protein ABZP36_019451 [Zizania latifolia]
MFFRIVVLLPAELLHVRNLIDKTTASGSEPKLPVVRVKVNQVLFRKCSLNLKYCKMLDAKFLQADYYGFSTIIPQRFGQKYIGKVSQLDNHKCETCFGGVSLY